MLVYIDDIGPPPTPEQIEKLKTWFEDIKLLPGIKIHTFSVTVKDRSIYG